MLQTVKITILGAGNVGGALGAAFRRVGHEVVFGVRDPDSDKTRAAMAASPGSRAESVASAMNDADVIVFALRWDAVPPTIAELPSLSGRIVIDAMNRLFGGDPTRSTTDDLTDLLPGAKLAKAFNTIGFENLSAAHERKTPAAMFVAGDDSDAKEAAMSLAREIGFEPYDAGPLANAKPLEEMVRVWLALAQGKSRRIGFAITEG